MNKKSSDEIIAFKFKRAIDVCFEREDKQAAISRINREYGVNISSCDMYIRNIRSMLEGERYTRNMSINETDITMKNFYSFNNGKYFKKALQSLKQHIKYSQEQEGQPLHRLREVLAKWSDKAQTK